MKAPRAVLLLLAALLCAGRVSSFLCWWCNGAESNWGCWRLQSCSSEDNYCATIYVGGGFGGYSKQSITKGCVSVCPASGIDIGIAAASVKCCSSSFCNISGVSAVKANHLLLALGILASIFCLKL